MKTLGDMAAYAKDAERAIGDCNNARKAVVEIVDGAQEKPRKKWLPF